MALQPSADIRTHPEQYLPERSQKEREKVDLLKNPRAPLDDPYRYQDVSTTTYPFFIDSPSVVFMGRIGEEPVTANFTIVNSSHRSFWFKIKTSSREMFKTSITCGQIEKSKMICISVIFYPNFQCPKPFCEYLNVYALLDDDKSLSAYEAFKRADLLPPMRKRLYMDFIWHPNIGITQAYEHGKLLDMMKSKYDLVNKVRRAADEKKLRTHAKTLERREGFRKEPFISKDEEREKEKKERELVIAKKEKTFEEWDQKKEEYIKLKVQTGKEYLLKKIANSFSYELSVVDATYLHRKNVVEKLMQLNREEIEKTSFMPESELTKHLIKAAKNKNSSRIATLVKNPKKNIDYQKLHKNSIPPEEYADIVWEEYKKDLMAKDKAYKDQDKVGKKIIKCKLSKLTAEELEVQKQREQQKKNKAMAEKKKAEEKANKEKEAAPPVSSAHKK
ncbi:unnamed protein product [Caenorhabditis brenneri]